MLIHRLVLHSHKDSLIDWQIVKIHILPLPPVSQRQQPHLLTILNLPNSTLKKRLTLTFPLTSSNPPTIKSHTRPRNNLA